MTATIVFAPSATDDQAHIDAGFELMGRLLADYRHAQAREHMAARLEAHAAGVAAAVEVERVRVADRTASIAEFIRERVPSE